MARVPLNPRGRGPGRPAPERGRTAGDRALRRALRGALRRAGADNRRRAPAYVLLRDAGHARCPQGSGRSRRRGLCAHHPPARLRREAPARLAARARLCLPETQAHPPCCRLRAGGVKTSPALGRGPGRRRRGRDFARYHQKTQHGRAVDIGGEIWYSVR